jgi:hypothetical protein
MSEDDLLLSRLEFGSLLSYSPVVNTDDERKAKNIMLNLKYDRLILKPPIEMSKTISKIIKEKIADLPFADFFSSNAFLVPVPNSALRKEDSLWVPQRIANEMVRKGFGKTTAEYLERVQRLPKSATCKPSERPKAINHYNSFKVKKVLPENPKDILLVKNFVKHINLRL